VSFFTFLDCHVYRMHATPKRVGSVTLLRFRRGPLEEATCESYNSMIPLFNPIMAAWVRSFAPNFERMFLTRLFTVSSVIES
jgi:hypothetical protein